MTTITEYARDVNIPLRVLRHLNRKAIIRDPLRAEDLVGLRFLERVWGDRELLRAQLRKLSLEARTSLIRTANLTTKWERYAYSRFRNLEEGSKLPMRKVIEEIEITFRFQLNDQQIRRLIRVRNRAQVARHREKNAQTPAGENLLQRAN
ncbi:MAG: hypothetical protein C4575_14245 [Desulforudis sp.]|nr:MAG: hypothetical protein C4575_14245 [Desulforudis sp.]